MNKLTAAERQEIADEMTRIMQEAEADTMSLEQIKDWAIANLTRKDNRHAHPL